MEMNWQPIETAPKDETVLLVCDATQTYRCIMFAWWGVDPNSQDGVSEWLSVDGDDWSCGYYYTPCDPTHWMPLPSIPNNT